MSTTLASRILDAFPSSTYSLAGLLRLVDIVETERVPTAAVECRAQPRLLLNPAFIAQHAATPQKLLMLVMHELHHVLLGHTTLFTRMTAARNFIFDAVINGMLCRMFPAPEYTALMRDFYGQDTFPHCLLAPPPGWPAPRVRRARALQQLPARLADRAHALHRALYSEGGATYAEVAEVLPRLLEAGGQGADVQDVPLLGDHDGSGQAGAGRDAEERRLADLLREALQDLDRMPSPLRGRSLRQVLDEGQPGAPPPRPARSALRDLLQVVAGRGRQAQLARPGWQALEVAAPLPRAHRRTLVQRALGLQPLLYPTPLVLPRPRSRGERVHVYVDVSGSMSAYLQPAYGAVLDCLPLVHPRVHLFSTLVHDISPAELQQGRCITGGGTDIACVAQHMAEHRVRRAVLLTDGEVGSLQDAHADVLRRVHLGVALVGGAQRQPLQPFARHLVVLPARSAA